MLDVEVPKCAKNPLRVPERVLMGPGPSNSSETVLKSLSLPLLGHMHPETFKIMDEIKDCLRYIFQTKNSLTLALSASGHGGMEASLCNLIEKGDHVLIANNGHWGLRASDLAARYGAEVAQVRADPGRSLKLEEIAAALKEKHYKLLFVTQGESSTGVLQPLEGLGKICASYNCLLVVDTVASLGAVPLFADRWGIDVVYTGSQKVLGAPPGITPITFSPKALDCIRSRKTPIPVYYWDMMLLGQYWGCFDKPRIYHHTISTTLLYGLRQALSGICAEGLEASWKRHQSCSERLMKGLESIGLDPFVEDKADRLPAINAVHAPSSWAKILPEAMTLGLEIGGGLGPTAGKILRIGVMGHNATDSRVDYVIQTLTKLIPQRRAHL